MTISITVGGTTVALSEDLVWNDELSWHPVEQTSQRTITGALVIQSALRVAGRPITLQPEDDSSAWLSSAAVTQLRNWAAVPGQVLSLTLRGTTRDVIFRHQDGAAIEAIPVVHFSDVAVDDWYRCTIRMMEI
jgi:hypothetical protein